MNGWTVRLRGGSRLNTVTFTQVIQTKAVWRAKTIGISLVVVLLACQWQGTIIDKETHDFPCPESYLLQSKSNMLCWLVRVDVTPSVVSWMLCAFQISVHRFKLGIVRK